MKLIFLSYWPQRLDDTNPQVRDAGMEVLGTLLKALGDRAMTAYLENVDKTKMAKVSTLVLLASVRIDGCTVVNE